jgi:NAD(P)-dependent dehydrogenase (short-subunit alcohol dehydrogenase family)
MSITTRISKRLPAEAPVVELDVTNPEQLAGLADVLREHVDGLDGVLHSIGFAPEAALGGNFLNTEWEDVATAVHVSAYSLKALTVACLPLMVGEGRTSSVVGLDFDAQVAWPKYDWMGVAKAAFESTARYLARDLGPQGVRVNLVAARSRRRRRSRSRASTSSTPCGRPVRRSAGTCPTPSRPRAPASPCCRTGSPRRPPRSSTSTAASTPWAPDAVRAASDLTAGRQVTEPLGPAS